MKKKSIAHINNQINLPTLRMINRFLNAVTRYFEDQQKNYTLNDYVENPDNQLRNNKKLLFEMTSPDIGMDIRMTTILKKHFMTIVKLLTLIQMEKKETVNHFRQHYIADYDRTTTTLEGIFLTKILQEIMDKARIKLNASEIAFLGVGIRVLYKLIRYQDVLSINAWIHMFQFQNTAIPISKTNIRNLGLLYSILDQLSKEFKLTKHPHLVKFRQTLDQTLQQLYVQQIIPLLQAVNSHSNVLQLMLTINSESLWEQFFNIHTTGNNGLSSKLIRPRLGGYVGYAGSDYSAIAKTLLAIPFSANDVFVDFGCGLGRMLAVVGSLTMVRKVIGIEIMPNHVFLAKNNLKNCPVLHASSAIIETDASDFDPYEGTVFYFFNPFTDDTFKTVITNIGMSLKRNPRPIKIIYYNPVMKSYLDDQPWLIQTQTTVNGLLIAWKNQ